MERKRIGKDWRGGEERNKEGLKQVSHPHFRYWSLYDGLKDNDPSWEGAVVNEV